MAPLFWARAAQARNRQTSILPTIRLGIPLPPKIPQRGRPGGGFSLAVWGESIWKKVPINSQGRDLKLWQRRSLGLSCSAQRNGFFICGVVGFEGRIRWVHFVVPLVPTP